MADVQLLAASTDPAPKEYELPAGQELVLKACFAHFDGTAAGAAWLPTLEIVSDSGHVAASIPMDASVAAGAEVEATWGPFLRGATAPPAPSAAGVPSATITFHDAAFADTGFALATLDMNVGSFLTDDASVFSAQTVGGNGCIEIAAPGDYLCIAEAFALVTVPPAAGSLCQVDVQSLDQRDALGPRLQGWLDLDGFGDFYAEPTRGVTMIVAAPSAPPPQDVFVRVGQNSGAAADLHATLTVYQMNPTPA